jgi:hypothetical protein
MEILGEKGFGKRVEREAPSVPQTGGPAQSENADYFHDEHAM